MKEIKLTQGKVALVDDADFEWLSQRKWYAWRATETSHWYAVHTGPARERLYMHRVILGLAQGDPRMGDHRNNEQTLNNQRENLRIADDSQNQYNSKRKHLSSTGFKNVRRHARSARKHAHPFAYSATIRVKGKRLFLGYRDTPEEAFVLVCEAAKQHHGEFARTA